jgi:uncharacterized membrane protein
MTETAEENIKTLVRIVSFTDAVYAIALTLLAFNLQLPAFNNSHSPVEMLQQLQLVGSKFSAFLLGALIIGGNWISSVHLQRSIAKTDQGYIIYVLINVVIISLLPFCGHLIGAFSDNPLSFVIFGTVNGLFMINGYFIYGHLFKNKLLHANADLVQIKKLHKAIPLMFLCMVAIGGIAFISTKAAFLFFLLWSLFPFFLGKQKHEKKKNTGSFKIV